MHFNSFLSSVTLISYDSCRSFLENNPVIWGKLKSSGLLLNSLLIVIVLILIIIVIINALINPL